MSQATVTTDAPTQSINHLSQIEYLLIRYAVRLSREAMEAAGFTEDMILAASELRPRIS